MLRNPGETNEKGRKKAKHSKKQPPFSHFFVLVVRFLFERGATIKIVGMRVFRQETGEMVTAKSVY